MLYLKNCTRKKGIQKQLIKFEQKWIGAAYVIIGVGEGHLWEAPWNCHPHHPLMMASWHHLICGWGNTALIYNTNHTVCCWRHVVCSYSYAGQHRLKIDQILMLSYGFPWSKAGRATWVGAHTHRWIPLPTHVALLLIRVKLTTPSGHDFHPCTFGWLPDNYCFFF